MALDTKYRDEFIELSHKDAGIEFVALQPVAIVDHVCSVDDSTLRTIIGQVSNPPFDAKDLQASNSPASCSCRRMTHSMDNDCPTLMFTARMTLVAAEELVGRRSSASLVSIIPDSLCYRIIACIESLSRASRQQKSLASRQECIRSMRVDQGHG